MLLIFHRSVYYDIQWQHFADIPDICFAMIFKRHVFRIVHRSVLLWYPRGTFSYDIQRALFAMISNITIFYDYLRAPFAIILKGHIYCIFHHQWESFFTEPFCSESQSNRSFHLAMTHKNQYVCVTPIFSLCL